MGNKTNWLVEVGAKREVGEGGEETEERVNWLIELSKREMGEGGRERVNWLVESPSKREVGEGVGETRHWLVKHSLKI